MPDFISCFQKIKNRSPSWVVYSDELVVKSGNSNLTEMNSRGMDKQDPHRNNKTDPLLRLRKHTAVHVACFTSPEHN